MSKKLTRQEREDLCLHDDPLLADYLTRCETGRIGVIHSGGRGASRKPRTDGTLQVYRSTLNALHRYLDGATWGEARESDLEDFLHRPVGDEARSLTTANRDLSTIRGFYRYLMAYKHVPFEMPDDDPSAFVRIDPQQLKRPEIRQPVPDPAWLTIIHSPKLSTDDRVACGLGYYVGLRREEIVSVAPNAIDSLHKRILFVDRKGGKTKTGLEYGELVEVLCEGRPEVADGAREWVDLVEFYAKYRQGEATLLPDYDVAHPGQRFKDRFVHHILPDAGLGPLDITPHQLRHSFGTNMALCGMDVERIADQMSHSSVETTMRYINAAGQIAAWRRRQKGESGAAAAYRQTRTGQFTGSESVVVPIQQAAGEALN